MDAIEVGETELPPLSQGEVLVEAAYTGISPGTELRAMAGKQDGDAGISRLFPAIRCPASWSKPGRGRRFPSERKCIRPGRATPRTSRLWGAHISHAIKGENEVYPLPDGVDLKDAAIIRLLAIAYHGVRLIAPGGA